MNRVLLTAASALALGGCAFRPQMTQVALDHNELVARTEDELTLLNIVRARNQYPMHFTTITILRGNATATFSAESGFSLPQQGGETSFDKDGVVIGSKLTKRVDSVTPKVSGSISTNPSFEMGVLNTDKFQRGIQQPINPELMEYFLDQGWPSDLIGALFIERIDLVASEKAGGHEKGDIVGRIENRLGRQKRPQESDGFEDLILNHYIRPIRTAGGKKALTPLQPLLGKSSISDLALLDGKAFDTNFEEAGEQNSVVFRLSPPKLRFELISVPGHSDTGFRVAEGIFKPDDGLGKAGGTFKTASTTITVEMRMAMRSVQGVIYFVGEYARVANPTLLKDDMALFTLCMGKGPSALETKMSGERYFIPRTIAETKRNGLACEGSGRTHRSLQVLDIIQQLLNMHKSADDLPATRSVNLVR